MSSLLDELVLVAVKVKVSCWWALRTCAGVRAPRIERAPSDVVASAVRERLDALRGRVVPAHAGAPHRHRRPIGTASRVTERLGWTATTHTTELDRLMVDAEVFRARTDGRASA